MVELFTSQGCSSCPPADQIIGELAKDPSVIALSLPIDYWDYLGWKDTLADSRFSARQKAYSHVRGEREVYTPQVVVNGSAHVIGSDLAGIESAIDDTKKAGGVMSVPVSLTVSGKQINVSVAASGEGPAHGEVWICSISKAVPISIGRGENRGREITYHNVVRNLLKGGLCPGRQPRQARSDVRGGLHLAALNFPYRISGMRQYYCQVGNSRLGWRRLGIHAPRSGYGLRARSFHLRPGMTIFIGAGTSRWAI